MGDVVTVKVEGLRELHRRMAQLAPNVAAKHLRAATTGAAVVVRDAIKQRAPQYTGSVAAGHPPPGTLKRAIAIRRSKRGSTKSRAHYEVFVRHWGRSGKTKKQTAAGVAAYSKYDAYYWRFVEFGTARMSPRSFMRTGFEAQKQAALAKLQERLRAGVYAEVKAFQ